MSKCHWAFQKNSGLLYSYKRKPFGKFFLYINVISNVPIVNKWFRKWSQKLCSIYYLKIAKSEKSSALWREFLLNIHIKFFKSNYCQPLMKFDVNISWRFLNFRIIFTTFCCGLSVTWNYLENVFGMKFIYIEGLISSSSISLENQSISPISFNMHSHITLISVCYVDILFSIGIPIGNSIII